MEEVIVTEKKPLIYNTQLQDFEKYAMEAHRSTNHYYDEYLPYEFHLRMVVKNGKDFLGLVEDGLWSDILMALWGHDLAEDARQSYNDVKKRSNTYVAEIVRACTNIGRGRNRKERMPDYVYEEIKTTPGALFVKLCDRMANVQYSKMSGSDKFEMYQREHAHFKKMLYTPGFLEPMWEYIESLFSSVKS